MKQISKVFVLKTFLFRSFSPQTTHSIRMNQTTPCQGPSIVCVLLNWLRQVGSLRRRMSLNYLLSLFKNRSTVVVTTKVELADFIHEKTSQEIQEL